MSVLQNILIFASIGLAIALLIVAWRAKVCGAGWRVWFLSVVARVYIGLMIRWESNKPCPFPQEEAAIIVGNHTSPVDPILIWYRHNASWNAPRLRTIGFLVASEYAHRTNVVGWVCRTMESIPVKRAGRDMAGVRQALSRLKAGKWLGIFPEGGINKTPEAGLNDFNTGAAFISLKSGVPIYPVFIENAPRAKTMAGSFFVRTKVRIHYGEPIDLAAKFGDQKLNTETLTAATQFIRESIERIPLSTSADPAC